MNKARIIIRTSGALGSAPGKALQCLRQGLRERGCDARSLPSAPPHPAAAGREAAAEVALDINPQTALFAEGNGPCPPEAFRIDIAGQGIRRRINITGSDETGLMYGIFELLGQVESSPRAGRPLAAARPVARTPRHCVRNVCLFPQNHDLERAWLYSREHWEAYFQLLARSRFNSFSLIFGHQTSYFAPPYPFFIAVPGYEHVRIPAFAAGEREQNLEMLKTISALAGAWGIRFVLGIWQQHAYRYGRNMVAGLAYADLFAYCPKALYLLLRECPAIQGIQFRVNHESGIAEHDQARFYLGLADAIRDLNRPMWIELRAKGLKAETILGFRERGLDIKVSTKFWCEHMGLPHFAAEINPADKKNYRRYGYWDLLRKDRPYKMFYELWTVGSQKLLLWGDLAYAGQLAESCHLGDALGFGICAPLSNKGYLNRPGGDWRIMADRRREYYRWEFEKYWAFYMAFGLQGYAPDKRQPIFQAEFCKRFGQRAAPAVQAAYSAASGIIPLITAFHAPSASLFRYWPEMDTGGLTEVYIGIPPADAGRFYSIGEYVDDRLAGKVSAKLSPHDISRRLEQMAAAAMAALKQAGGGKPGLPGNKELAMTRIDIETLAQLARYHAARIISGTAMQFFRKTGRRPLLLQASAALEKAIERWQRIAELTAGVYYEHMVFGLPPSQTGLWKDELPFLAHDLERLRAIDKLFMKYHDHPADAGALEADPPWYKLMMTWEEKDGVVSRRAGAVAPAEPLRYPVYETNERHIMQAPAAVIKELFATVSGAGTAHDFSGAAAPAAARLLMAPSGRAKDKPQIVHNDIRQCRAGEPLGITAAIRSSAGLQHVRLHYRHLIQTEDWQAVDMKKTGADEYEAVIPGHFILPEWDLMYAFEVIDKSGGGVFYPDLDIRPPFVAVQVVRPGEASLRPPRPAGTMANIRQALKRRRSKQAS